MLWSLCFDCSVVETRLTGRAGCTLPGASFQALNNSRSGIGHMRRAGPVVAEFLAFGEVPPGVEGLVDGDEVGEIDHDFGDTQVGDAVAVAPFETD